MTNAAGQFVVRGLRNGSLFLVVTKGGYVDATNAQRRPLGTAQRIEVAAGQRITDVEVRMWKYAAIAGTVTDELGEPVVGVRVQAYRRVFAAGRTRYAASVSATTDDRGMYRIANVPPGDFQIAVVSMQSALPSAAIDALRGGTSTAERRAELSREIGALGSLGAPAGTPFAISTGTHTLSLSPGTATTTAQPDGSLIIYPSTFYPSSMLPSASTIVSVRAGEERVGVDVQLQPVRGVRVAGMLLAPGEYVDHVPLRLVPVTHDVSIPEVETASTISDADGAFAFPAVPPGQYVLRAVRVPRPPPNPAPSGAPVVRSGTVSISATPPPPPGPTPPPPIPPDATLYADATIAVGDTDVPMLMLPLRPGPRVSGRVEFDGTGDPPDAATLAYVRISLDPADATRELPDGLGFATGRIDETGHFRTYGVPPGKYFIRVGGLSDWFLRGAVSEGHDVADEPVELTADLSSVVLTFTDRPSSVAGVVRAGSSPDGSAVVLVFPTDRSQWDPTGTAPRRQRTARANADGSYLFPSLPPGDYFILAVHETFEDEWRDPEFLESIAGSAEQVRLVEGERRTVDLRTIPDR